MDDEDFVMETNLSCANCGSFVLVYLPMDKDDVRTEKHCQD